MPHAEHFNIGMGSRVAVRTYLLFCFCALVPIGIFGGIGYAVVSSELRAHAVQRLAEASKHYGLLLNDRLIQSERSIAELGRAHTAGAYVPGELEPSDTRLSHVTVREMPLSASQKAETPTRTETVIPTLYVSDSTPPAIVMQVLVQENRHRMLVSAQLAPSDLWDAEAVSLTGMRLCVYAAGKNLTCTSPDYEEGVQIAGGMILSKRWTLFLKPRYGAGEWTIEASQPASVALAGLHTFQMTLLAAAGLACLAALLLSAVQIRRSHQPLATLIVAAQRLRAKRLDTRVKLNGSGEFAQLGRAFNQLASGLQRQFRILRAFSRIDRQILSNTDSCHSQHLQRQRRDSLTLCLMPA